VVAFCRRGFEQFNATVQWTVAGRRPAGGHTNLFLKEKGKRTPAGHQKAITPLGWWLFFAVGDSNDSSLLFGFDRSFLVHNTYRLIIYINVTSWITL